MQERLGHSSVAFTLDRYSHAIPAMQEDAAGAVARLVGLARERGRGVPFEEPCTKTPTG